MDVDTLNLSKVSLADDTLYIREWYSNHHTVTAYLAQADSTELANQVESLLVLGATVMTTAQPTLDLAHVKREFNDFQSRLEKSCQDFFGETGQLGNLLNGTHQTIAASLKQYLDESSANFVGFLVQKQVEALLIEQSQS